jgi:hypothetical protein
LKNAVETAKIAVDSCYVLLQFLMPLPWIDFLLQFLTPLPLIDFREIQGLPYS